jgi:hypothetical protein
MLNIKIAGSQRNRRVFALQTRKTRSLGFLQALSLRNGLKALIMVLKLKLSEEERR